MQPIPDTGVRAEIRRLNDGLEASFASGDAAGIAGVSTDEAKIIAEQVFCTKSTYFLSNSTGSGWSP